MNITHKIQLEILRNLLFSGKSTFSELNTTGLTNDHFTFHLKRLTLEGIIKKDKEKYVFTDSGLEYASRLDLSNLLFPPQPKVGVSLCVLDGNGNILLGKRLHNPNKGSIGFFTEKVRFGESVFETAKRCLKNETGLEGSFRYIGVIREIKSETSDLLLNYIIADNLKGPLQIKTDVSENFWVDVNKVSEIKNLSFKFLEILELIRVGQPFIKEIK